MTSKRVVVYYVFDWAIVFAAVAIALLLSTVNPDFHTFCLLDMNISYPYRPAKVSLSLFIFLAIIKPIIIIVFVSLVLGPKNQGSRQFTRQQIWRQKLWEMNAALLGIGVSLGTATVIFTGVKNLAGKPRPNFLERCQPDLENIATHTVGGFGQAISNLWVMVDVEICQQTDKKWLNDGFRSFPSGYATNTVAFAGLWYLSLYLCAKFNITVPSEPRNAIVTQIQSDETDEPLLGIGERVTEQSSQPQEPVAFPVFYLLLPYIPLGLAIFIAGTRYFDFRNHGFDVLAGSAIGTVTAWFGFRLYHPSLYGASRAPWGPRSSDRAFNSS